MKDQDTLVHNRGIFSFQFTRNIEKAPHGITKVSFLKDGKTQHIQIHCLPVRNSLKGITKSMATSSAGSKYSRLKN